MFSVSIEKQNALLGRMRALGVREADLEEKFIRASAPGGQNVNKVSTCVYLKHIPSGIEVKCQIERSQGLNRYLARRRLLDLIEKARTGFIVKEQARIEKIRRQKRRRSRRAKEKMLFGKRLVSGKKEQRAGIKPHLLKE